MATAASWSKRPWLGVLSRSCAAIFGGYALASAASVLLAMALRTPSQAVLTGMMVGILVCACAALWAFAAATAWRAWLGIVVPTLLMFALAALLRQAAA
ncbi:MAG TPA: DUF3649 domain-containing protein [Stenotrophomonas sp.]|nr:DUF3649 domain-containing protein [Stenotrophomonas sp.]